ncbi:MAG: hypothetical protein L6R28_14760 [Planctomycetes bacterium]|nr:hypothetical protein [Planctomycetota bacterium]
MHEEASSESHPGLSGLSREIAVEMLLRPLLPPDVAIGTGKIVDSEGNESTQLDIIIHDKDILPAAMYGNRFGLFPIEACLYVIEVKSTACARTAKEARLAAQKLATLRPKPGVIGVPCNKKPVGLQMEAHEVGAGYFPNYSYFAFSTDLTAEGSPARERERLLDGVKDHHQIHLCSICVVGSATSSWSRTGEVWKEVPASEKHDEVVYFLSTILNTLSKMRVMRPYPNIGNYLWD